MRKKPSIAHIAVLTLVGYAAFPLHAQTTSDLADQELQRQQQRERSRSEQAEQRPDVRLMQAGPDPITYHPEQVSPFSVEA